MFFNEVFNTLFEGAGGKIIANVNTTVDVNINSIKTEAAKFNNVVTPEGIPPQYQYGDIARSLIEEI